MMSHGNVLMTTAFSESLNGHPDQSFFIFLHYFNLFIIGLQLFSWFPFTGLAVPCIMLSIFLIGYVMLGLLIKYHSSERRSVLIFFSKVEWEPLEEEDRQLARERQLAIGIANYPFIR
uniref:Uncharacterized protein n=1 Tax=Acrobeloides nanus TaxID=290746 RepID=A0A914DXR2_9BILA